MKICLVGKHSNRTPFAYDTYKSFFIRDFTYTSSPELADILIFGFFIDLESNLELIKNCKKNNPSIKIVIISEEPLWDLLWSGNFFEQQQTRVIAGNMIHFTYLNHQNSDVFNFDKIPYFITTNDDYLARYQFMFSRNAKMSESEIENTWKNAPIDAAFFAEHREGDKYNISFPEHDVYGLCDFRTRIAKSFKGKNVLKVGQGWGTKQKRQVLPDWHLDKLTTLDKQCKFISALENTHQRNYISEKLFDAYACLSIPITLDKSAVQISKILRNPCLIKLPISYQSELSDFNFKYSASDYRENQEELRSTLILKNIFSEREKLSKKIKSELESIANETTV